MNRSWIAACALGEAVGIAAVATAYALASRTLVPDAPLIVSAGAFEGLALGTAQAVILSRRGVLPEGWIAATAIAAAFGYTLSLLAGAGAGDPDAAPPAAWLVVAGAAAIGLLMGLGMGFAQWLAARGRLNLLAWMLCNGFGWALAMTVIFTGATQIPEGLPLAVVAATGLVTGGLAGLVLGAITAFALPD